MGRLEAELQATRLEWAELVEEAGQAAVARELGVSRQAVADRLRRIRATARGGAVGGEGLDDVALGGVRRGSHVLQRDAPRR